LRFAFLLTALSAGVLSSLAAGRALLVLLPRPTPASSAASLSLEQRLALNPMRRREAALLLASRNNGAPRRQQHLLRSQGWGLDPLAAVALKQQALTEAALGSALQAQTHWQQLQRRHGSVPASADALYALGQRSALLQRWPAHPAALAGASEQADVSGALHLARWGARWPGAAERINNACLKSKLSAAQRQQLAQGLAELGAAADAEACLAGATPLPATALLLADVDLHSANADQQQRGAARLLGLIKRQPSAAAAQSAAALLAASDTLAAQRALASAAAPLQNSAAVQASAAREAPDSAAAIAVVQRWPRDASSWELQWHRARRSALAGRWRDTLALLQAGGPALEASMPAALQARRAFWMGLSLWQLGEPAPARSHWQQIVQRWPGGYYGWRAAARLGLKQQSSPAGAAPSWMPLASGDAQVDRLWRLGQPLEAFEHWRAMRRGRPASQSRALQAEGRLREAIGDGWAGLGQQELAALRAPAADCQLQQLIEHSRYQVRQRQPLSAAARSEQMPLPLLLGVAKQESRFQSNVRSVVGAQGLLQLMPETAAEVHGAALNEAQLSDPELNARLGARYLKQLLQRWRGNTLLAVASYNAGPNAVARWLTPQLTPLPELWVEAIPYPETRHYVKTVLGNSWSFSAPRLARCR